MEWNTQPRALEVVSNAIPMVFGQPIFEVVRVRGVDKLGTLFDYQIDVQTIESNGLTVNTMDQVLDVDKLVGQSLTLRIAIEGSGTPGDGEFNVGAGVREISGVISEVACRGSDDRRMYYMPAFAVSPLARELDPTESPFQGQERSGDLQRDPAEVPLQGQMEHHRRGRRQPPLSEAGLPAAVLDE